MRITKFGHACVRLEHEGSTVVVDPGVFTDPGALDGAGAVLITHEHPDHYHPDHLRSVDVPVWPIDDVAARIAEDAPDVAERVRPASDSTPDSPSRRSASCTPSSTPSSRGSTTAGTSWSWASDGCTTPATR